MSLIPSDSFVPNSNEKLLPLRNHSFFYEQMKKIIILANTSWNIHNFRRNILQMLLDASFEVVVVTPIDAFLAFLQDFPNTRHIPLQRLARKSINPLRDIELAKELIGIFKIEKPNIILNYTIKPNIIGGGAAQLLKIPYICVVTGLGYTFLHNGLLYFLTKILYRLAFQKAEKVIFENTDDRLLFNQLRICSPEKSLSVKGYGSKNECPKLFSNPINLLSL